VCGSEYVEVVDANAGTVVDEICLGGSTADLPTFCGDAWTAQVASDTDIGPAIDYTHDI
jgi:hypothetical protein